MAREAPYRPGVVQVVVEPAALAPEPRRPDDQLGHQRDVAQLDQVGGHAQPAEVVLDLRSHQGALVVPPAALVSEGTLKAVFIVENGVVRKVPIKTDIDDGVWVEVTSGLSGDEEVVVVGKSRVRDGAKVNASPSNLPAGKPASQKY